MRKTKSIRRFSRALLMVLPCALMPQIMLGQTATLEELQTEARNNYPLIRQYDLVRQTEQYTIENIQKGWLPQLSATAQATYQSAVSEFPSELNEVLQQMGRSMEGLKKDQYRIGLDVNQQVWDGGRLREQKKVATAQAEVETAQNDVNLYAVRERVNSMYFGTLLLDERLKVNADMQTLYQTNLTKLQNMYKHGTVMRADVSAMEAELLSTKQQETELNASRQQMLRMLALLCGRDKIDGVEKPTIPQQSADASNRPELLLINSQIRLLDQQERLLDTQSKPRLSLFAQGWYGYPGLNMFEDMMSHKWTLNGLIGARLTWNISSLYTRKSDKAKIQTQRDKAENQREVFLFNNKIEQVNHSEAAAKYAKMMGEDDKLVALRADVRKAAESKLNHGIIDVSGLVQEITREHTARNQQSQHEVEMLYELYKQQHTTN